MKWRALRQHKSPDGLSQLMCRDHLVLRPATIRLSLADDRDGLHPAERSQLRYLHRVRGCLPELIDDLRIEHRRVELSRLQP